MAAKNKCLAQMNKSGTAGKTTKKARNPASRVNPMGADHRVVPAIKQALSMLPQPWSQRAMLTSNDYKELAARCTELASESSEPTVAEPLRALASDYLARAAKLHFVFLRESSVPATSESQVPGTSGSPSYTPSSTPGGVSTGAGTGTSGSPLGAIHPAQSLN
jgi:hypothetical protein